MLNDADKRHEESDRLANKRVRLRHVLSKRLGMPDRFDVYDRDGRPLAMIVATEDAIEIIGERLTATKQQLSDSSQMVRLTFGARAGKDA